MAWQDFIVVDFSWPYNATLGHPTLGKLKAITSTYHLVMKFPTIIGLGEVRGNWKVSIQYFMTALKANEK